MRRVKAGALLRAIKEARLLCHRQPESPIHLSQLHPAHDASVVSVKRSGGSFLCYYAAAVVIVPERRWLLKILCQDYCIFIGAVFFFQPSRLKCGKLDGTVASKQSVP